ncbi:MAG TPA: hypothetical protein DCW42_06395 [Bacteroidetes bacterium]|nr:hypothetical protein [Bacteroidota bacterium]
MKMKSSRVLYYFVIQLLAFGIAIAQNPDKSNPTAFFMDVISVKSNKNDSSRVDIYTAVPYQSLLFLKSDDGKYYAKYSIITTIFNNKQDIAVEMHTERFVKADNYFVSLGGNGDFDFFQSIAYLPENDYKVQVKIIDLISNQNYKHDREISVINFDKYPFALSGLMLVSSIFETNGKKSITPYLNDNVSELLDGFFLFFESYNKLAADTVDFVYQISKDEKDILFTSDKVRRYIPAGTSQQYIKINSLKNLTTGTYVIKLIALKPSAEAKFSEADYLAATKRTITYIPSLAGNVIENLDLAIKQLRYVATNSQIEYIRQAASEDDKLNRFREFWATLDPTPNTQRNEAFEEYYSRVDYANQNFKSYTDGWMTDKGMVYIIFGPPVSYERKQDYYNPNRIYERWTYGNNREFLFVDNNGFGDFRLSSPTAVTEKYEYRRG